MRIDSPRDTLISTREDMIRDFVDALVKISTLSGYNTNPKKVIPWQIDPFSDKDLPAITVFDFESDEEDNGNKVKHTLEISFEYIAASDKGENTSGSLRQGASDILKAIGEIEERFCIKYKTNLLSFTGTSMGLDGKQKVDGGISVKIRTVYNTRRWEI